MTSKTIRFLPLDRVVQCKGEESVLQVALRHGIPLAHSCGGMGSCTTCRIFVESSGEPLPERTELEVEISEPRNFAENERLACQLPPLKDLVVRIPTDLDGDADLI